MGIQMTRILLTSGDLSRDQRSDLKFFDVKYYFFDRIYAYAARVRIPV